MATEQFIIPVIQNTTKNSTIASALVANAQQNILGYGIAIAVIVVAIVMIYFFLFRRKKYFNADKQKVISKYLLESNENNRYDGMGWVYRNNEKLYKIKSFGYYFSRKDKCYLTCLTCKPRFNNRIAGLLNPICGWNWLAPKFVLIVSDSKCTIDKDKLSVYLKDYLTLFSIDRVTVCLSDKSSMDFYFWFSGFLNVLILDSGKYGQYNKHTIFSLSEITKRHSEYSQVEFAGGVKGGTDVKQQ